MSRILVGFMILFTSGLTTADDLENLTVTGLLHTLYEWGMKMYEIIEKHNNPDKSEENIEKIMSQVNEVSSKIDKLESHLDIKLDSMLNMLLVDIRLENSLNTLKAKLRHCFSKIDRYFHDSREYEIGGAYGNETLKDFSFKALWSSGSVPDFLDEMNEVFLPNGVGNEGFLSVMLERTILNILHDCDTNMSPQQMVYYIYIQVFITEIKALITQQQTIMIQRYFDKTLYNYTSELNSAKTKFRRHLTNYYTLFTHKILQFPQNLRRCEASPPTRGINYIEMQKFSRIIILDSDVVYNDRCVACPQESTLSDLSRRTNTTINDCKDMGTTLRSCSAESGSPHKYLWWQDEGGNHYGPNTPCDNEKNIDGGSVRIPGYRGNLDSFIFCKVCACTAQTNDHQNDASAIWRISVTEQYSDIFNNKVVTGVRFVTQNNALHIQIRHARFSHSGMIHDDNQWKDLELGFNDAGIVQTKTPMHLVSLRPDRKTLYLDDIKVPDGYAVTGVKLELVDNSAFKLRIYKSEFKLDTGEVFPFGGDWIDATTHPMNPDDYNQKRSEINMGESDDPTRASQFEYDLQSNKLIKFTHTDINKDAGQTTIPLIDSQSVEAQPPFPLGGIGISFRGRKGFGGYIAPRIFTFDVTQSMMLPITNSDEQPISTTTEKVEWEIQYVDGETNTQKNRVIYYVEEI